MPILKEPKSLDYFFLPFRVLCFLGPGFNGSNSGKYVHFIFLKVEILLNFIFIATSSISRMNDEGDFPGGPSAKTPSAGNPGSPLVKELDITCCNSRVCMPQLNSHMPQLKDLAKRQMASPGGSASKEPACNVRDLGSIPGWGRSPRGQHGNPLQSSCLEDPTDKRSLVGCKQLDMTKQLTLSHFHMTAKTWYSQINKYFLKNK